MPYTTKLREDRSEVLQYDSPDYPIYIRRGLLSDYLNYSAASHWHEDVELILILDGEMTYQVNGNRLQLKKGEGIFVNSGQLHFGYSPDRTECDYLCVILHPMLLCAVPLVEQRYILPVTHNTAQPYIHLTACVPWHQQLLKLIAKFYQDKRSFADSYLKTQANFFELWALLYAQIADPAVVERSENPDLSITKNMLRFIQTNYSHTLSLSEIASVGAVGQSKCCKLFRQYLGKSPIQYLNHYRLSKSVVLLTDSHLSITEIALQVGFGGGSYYTEAFRRWAGQTPSEYRSQHTRSLIE